MDIKLCGNCHKPLSPTNSDIGCAWICANRECKKHDYHIVKCYNCHETTCTKKE